MSGSKRVFEYEDERGNEWAITADESNIEAVQGAPISPQTTIPTRDFLPRNIKPRYARFSNSAGTINKSIVVLTASRFSGIAADFTIDVDDPTGSNTPITLRLVELVGESRKSPKFTDSGLNDGD